MDALILSINGIRQIAAELREESSVSVSISWIGGANINIFTVYLARYDNYGLHKWDPFRVALGDLISFNTTAAMEIDNPIESLTNTEQIERVKNQPKMIPNDNRDYPSIQIAGTLDWYINHIHIFSTQLNNEKILSVEFVWLGDRTGMSTVYLGSDVSPDLVIPSIGFGDEVTFRTRPYQAGLSLNERSIEALRKAAE